MLGSWFFLLNGLKQQTCHAPQALPPLPLPKPTGACLSFDWKDVTKLLSASFRDRCAERPSPPPTLILPGVGLSPHPGFGSQHPRVI